MTTTHCPEAERTIESLRGLITKLRIRITDIQQSGQSSGVAIDYLHDRIDALETAADLVRTNFGITA